MILLKALIISFLKLSESVSGHVNERIKFVSVCSTKHMGNTAFLIKVSISSSSWFLLKFFSYFLFRSKFGIISQSSSSGFKVYFEQRPFTVIAVVYFVL